jgi:hypothetical protein
MSDFTKVEGLLELDATSGAFHDGRGVRSAQHLSVPTGDPQIQLHIFTGVASINFWTYATDQIFEKPVSIKLMKVTAQLVDSATVVSLGGATLEDDFGQWHANDSHLEQSADGTLRLRATALVNGDAYGLIELAYQVNAVLRPIQTAIRGKVRWSSAEFHAQRDHDLFDVDAERVSGTGALGIQNFETVKKGEVSNESGKGTKFPSCDFVIRDVPLQEQLFVFGDLRPGAFAPVPGSTLSVEQVAGPRPVTLSIKHPEADGIVLELKSQEVPR